MLLTWSDQRNDHRSLPTGAMMVGKHTLVFHLGNIELHNLRPNRTSEYNKRQAHQEGRYQQPASQLREPTEQRRSFLYANETESVESG
jgi:hypothetical protein